MNLVYNERLSDSPYVERIWHTRSEGSKFITSVASSYWTMVTWQQYGKTYFDVRGPETHTTIHVPVPEDCEFVGIVFKHGTFMPHMPINNLLNSEISLPTGTGQSFWLDSSLWEVPTFDNVDTFVNRMVRGGVLVREPIVNAAVYGHLPDLSARSIQRRVLRTTGLTYNAIWQIQRARQATIRLQEGASILDTAFAFGYADQPHLTRSLKLYVGQTPTQIMDHRNAEQMSFLFKTQPAT